MPQYLEKFTKHHFLNSGENFLSSRDQGGQTPHINGGKKLCVYGPSQKKKDGTLGAVTPKRVIEDLLLFHESPLKTHLPLFSDIQ